MFNNDKKNRIIISLSELCSVPIKYSSKNSIIFSLISILLLLEL